MAISGNQWQSARSHLLKVRREEQRLSTQHIGLRDVWVALDDLARRPERAVAQPQAQLGAYEPEFRHGRVALLGEHAMREGHQHAMREGHQHAMREGHQHAMREGHQHAISAQRTLASMLAKKVRASE